MQRTDSSCVLSVCGFKLYFFVGFSFLFHFSVPTWGRNLRGHGSGRGDGYVISCRLRHLRTQLLFLCPVLGRAAVIVRPEKLMRFTIVTFVAFQASQSAFCHSSFGGEGTRSMLSSQDLLFLRQ